MGSVGSIPVDNNSNSVSLLILLPIPAACVVFNSLSLVASKRVHFVSSTALIKVMERPNSKIPAMKASSNAAAPQLITNRNQSRRDRKIALQQDVDKLRKKLRHEENVHRALERAFTRPLGALPRLPPYLPSQTLELLAEVAVLEEEVVRLEEQVVSFRQGLYEEAVIISMAKSAYFSDTDRCSPAPRHGQVPDQAASANWSSLKRVTNVKQTPRRPCPSLNQRGDCPGKENQSCTTNSFRDHSRFPLNTVPKCSNPAEEKCAGFQTVRSVKDYRGTEDTTVIDSENISTEANEVSEELLTCLLNIFSQIRSSSDKDEDRSPSPSVSGSEGVTYAGDPYGVLELGSRDIGPYKQFRAVDATSFDQNVFDSTNSLLGRRLKALLQKISSADLVGLSHQQKLAFWINTYNSCMMNAFLEHGAPTTPQMLVAMMPKATINVGGRVLSAMTIEHFILRLPYNAKHVNPKGVKSGNGAAAAAAARGVSGLDWPEPSVTFALSCGSWSSPAVRVYTACHVEEELEAAKRDYLQAAVGVSTATSISIPKLLHWYLLDFAKDVSSLMDWVCLQLPDELQRHAVEVVEASRRSPSPRPVHVVPYEFRFRYLLAT
uniref:Ternary complex factor MIP1 leucine-zipper domain-containing protein n=1 Tax=Oryza punctata TaxID=4537 RepID=A0A0E0LVW9_ORYPU